MALHPDVRDRECVGTHQGWRQSYCWKEWLERDRAQTFLNLNPMLANQNLSYFSWSHSSTWWVWWWLWALRGVHACDLLWAGSSSEPWISDGWMYSRAFWASSSNPPSTETPPVFLLVLGHGGQVWGLCLSFSVRRPENWSLMSLAVWGFFTAHSLSPVCFFLALLTTFSQNPQMKWGEATTHLKTRYNRD